MNIQNIFSGQATASLSNLGSVASTPNSPSSIPPAAIGAAATANVSTPGQFFSELQQLSQQNPTEFKAVAAQLATSFQNAASQASGPQASFLSTVANQLNQAAQTGQLQPPQGAGGMSQAGGAHHHHHHGGGSSSTGQSSEVQQAFQNGMSILEQALQGTSSSPEASTTASST